MIRIVLDPTSASKLNQLSSVAEICDEQGRVLGVFMPRFDPADYEIINPPTEEELAEAERNLQGRPLADIMKDLENRT
jgi:hypothetical protein